MSDEGLRACARSLASATAQLSGERPEDAALALVRALRALDSVLHERPSHSRHVRMARRAARRASHALGLAEGGDYAGAPAAVWELEGAVKATQRSVERLLAELEPDPVGAALESGRERYGPTGSPSPGG